MGYNSSTSICTVRPHYLCAFRQSLTAFSGYTSSYIDPVLTEDLTSSKPWALYVSGPALAKESQGAREHLKVP